MKKLGAIQFIGGLAALLIACVLIGGYCGELNRQLYQFQCPFYDSLSYFERLARVMTLATEINFSSGLQEACFSDTTVCLPFLIAVVISPFTAPDRLVGVWIQTGFLFLLLASLYSYFTNVRELRPITSMLGAMVFLLSGCLFFDNGGLSDFRMDLGLALTFGITACWFLSAIERPRWWRFVLLGLAAGACCLTRATAPIYLVAAFFPPAIAHLFFDLERKRIFVGLTIAACLAAAVAGWFYILNLDYLHFYYAVWNTDANARIAWSETLNHLKFAQRCVGDSIIYWLVLGWIGVAVVSRLRHRNNATLNGHLKGHFEGSVSSNKNGDRRIATLTGQIPAGELVGTCSGARSLATRHIFQNVINRFREPTRQNEDDIFQSSKQTWSATIFWIGIAPTAIIMLRRAGLNPFVCMPSVIGLILFFVLPLLHRLDALNSKNLQRYCWIGLLVCVVAAGQRGWKRHQPGTRFNSMLPQKIVMDEIIADSQNVNQQEFTFAALQLTDLNALSLYSTLIFDREGTTNNAFSVSVEVKRYRILRDFCWPAAINWEELAGPNDKEKVAGLMQIAEEKIDYLVVPTADSVEYLRTAWQYNYGNRYLSELRAGVVAGPWKKFAGPIQVQPQEFVEIYRNIARGSSSVTSSDRKNLRR